MARTAPASLVVPKLQALARQPVLTAADRGAESIRAALSSEYVHSGMELIDQWSDDPLMDSAADELYYTFPLRPSDDKSWEWELGVLADSTGGATVRIVAGSITVQVVIPPGSSVAGGWISDTDTGDHSGLVTSATVDFSAFVDCEVYGVYFRPTRSETTLPAGHPSAYTNDVVPPDQAAYDGDSPLTPTARHSFAHRRSAPSQEAGRLRCRAGTRSRSPSPARSPSAAPPDASRPTGPREKRQTHRQASHQTTSLTSSAT